MCLFLGLSSAERNYDVGDWELLAVKLALEEWQHWLEGSKYSVVVWTDPKNFLICWCIDLGDREDRVRRSAAGG